MIWFDLMYLLAELVLTVGGSLLLLAPVFGGRGGSKTAKWWMLGLLAATAAAIVYSSHAVEGMRATDAFHRMFVLDGFSIFFKLLFTGIIALIVFLSDDFLQEERYSAWEYYALLTFALLGMTFMASGVHLISIYVGLELMSLSSYVLAGYFKNQTKSTEAAMKYFVLGAVSSAILLYGMSLIYGVCGSLRLTDIHQTLAATIQNDALTFGIILMAAGLCFKIAAAPFHVWTPDVYVGAPTPITAFLSSASKAAAFTIFARIFYLGLSHFRVDWGGVLATVAALSMIVGNLAAITQDNVKRMLAYSSIGHAGYGLLGILAMNEMGLYAILVYMLVYAFANLGIWGTIIMLRRKDYAGERVDDFDGLHDRAPLLAFSMVVFLLSLGGIPPTAGFVGKYYLFAAAVESGYGWLAIVAVMMSAVSVFYYFRFVVAMYLKDSRETPLAISPGLRFAVTLCLVATLILGLVPERMLRGVRDSLKTFAAVTVAQR